MDAAIVLAAALAYPVVLGGIVASLPLRDLVGPIDPVDGDDEDDDEAALDLRHALTAPFFGDL